MQMLKIECVDRGGPVIVWLVRGDGTSEKLASVLPTHPQDVVVEIGEEDEDEDADGLGGDPYSASDPRFEDEEEADE